MCLEMDQENSIFFPLGYAEFGVLHIGNHQKWLKKFQTNSEDWQLLYPFFVIFDTSRHFQILVNVIS